MTHRITVQFEVDASNWEYPENGMPVEEQMELDFTDLDTMLMAIEDQEYTVKVEKI